MWLISGVPQNKIETTGISVNIEKSLIKEIINKYHLDNLPTILIISGKEGVGDYIDLIENIIKKCSFPVQIIAVCRKNKIQKLKLKLSPNVKTSLYCSSHNII
jgi:processive 1,2-diacylglycerol beta-glucosyltransferase